MIIRQSSFYCMNISFSFTLLKAILRLRLAVFLFSFFLIGCCWRRKMQCKSGNMPQNVRCQYPNPKMTASISACFYLFSSSLNLCYPPPHCPVSASKWKRPHSAVHNDFLSASPPVLFPSEEIGERGLIKVVADTKCALLIWWWLDAVYSLSIFP